MNDWTEDESKCLHRLRNPYGYSEDEMRWARLAAADLIEHYKDAYGNMKAWAEENGLDTTCYGRDKA
jgi:hypothetical protein